MDESDQMITKLIGQGNPLIQDFDKALVNRIKPNGTMVTDSKSAYQEVSKKYKCSLVQIPSGFHTLDTYNLGTLNGLHGEMKQWFQKFKAKVPGCTVGMDLQAPHFAYAPDERAFPSVAAFYKGKSRLKVGLIPEKCYRKSDVYFWTRTHSGALCENWS